MTYNIKIYQHSIWGADIFLPTYRQKDVKVESNPTYSVLLADAPQTHPAQHIKRGVISKKAQKRLSKTVDKDGDK